MKKNKPKFYVVWKGRDTGVFYTWAECKAAIDKFEGALYKSYESEEEAFADAQPLRASAFVCVG